MNEYYKAFKESVNDRDFVFTNILASYNEKPIDILEIGCARNLDCFTGKSGDGWSSLFFAEYVEQNYGSLEIVELDVNNLKNCMKITEDFVDHIIYVHMDGIDFLKKDNNFDLIFLDAGDDPQITLEMFELCDRTKSDILIDDANIGGKADLVRPKYPDYQLFKCNQVHEMIFYPKINE